MTDVQYALNMGDTYDVGAIITALIGIGASYKIYEIGHSGAKATWSDVKIKVGGEGGEPGEG